jgi:hypothetical protein
MADVVQLDTINGSLLLWIQVFISINDVQSANDVPQTYDVSNVSDTKVSLVFQTLIPDTYIQTTP